MTQIEQRRGENEDPCNLSICYEGKRDGEQPVYSILSSFVPFQSATDEGSRYVDAFRSFLDRCNTQSTLLARTYVVSLSFYNFPSFVRTLLGLIVHAVSTNLLLCHFLSW